MDEKESYYIFVKVDLHEELEVKRYLQNVMENAFLLMVLGKKSAFDVASKATKANKKAGFTMENNFLFPSK